MNAANRSRVRTLASTSLALLICALALLAIEARPRLSLGAEPPAASPGATPSPDAPAGSAEMPTGHFVLGPGRSLPVTLEGVDGVVLRLFRVPPNHAHHVFPILGSHPQGERPLEHVPLGTVRDEASLMVQPMGPTYGASDVEVPVFDHIDGDLALAVLEGPDRTQVALCERGRLAVLLKRGQADGVLWVADTETESPVSGARVTVRQGSSVRLRGTTDARGLLKLPGDDELRLSQADGGDAWYRPLTVVVEHGRRAGLASERWDTGLSPWQYGIAATYYAPDETHTGMVTAERGIYRPSEAVHVLGILRKRLPNGRLAPPGGSVQLTVRAPDGTLVFDEAAVLTEFGTFHAVVRLGRHAALGRYHVTAERGETTVFGEFEVGEYRTARFEVSVESEDAETGATVSAAVRYLYGAAVKGANVRWSMSVRAGRLALADGFAHGPEGRDFIHLREVATGKAQTDGAGRITLDVERDALPDSRTLPAQVLDVVHEVTVTDAAGDTITGQHVAPTLRTEAIAAVRSNDWLADPKRGWSVDVKAVNAAGEAIANQQLSVELIHRRYKSVARVHRGRTFYEGRWEESVVETRSVTTRITPTPLNFKLPSGGTYRVRARLAKAEAYAEASVWAYGGGTVGGGADNDPRVELVTDRESYAPGDRARLLVGSPYPKALALVTVERNGVMFAEPRTLAAGDPITVDVEEAYLPGAYASVALLPAGLGRRGPAAGVPFRMGYAELSVSPEKRRLEVDIRPDRSAYRPGRRASVTVRVTDDAGRPVRAEVTLWAADEGVLMLTGYETPSAFESVYDKRPLGVLTSTNLVRWFQPGLGYDDGSGGDYGQEGSAFRSRFLSTAFFSEPVVTDARGRATVSFDLPDNLTRWRLMASVADGAERFGSGQASLVVDKPVSIEPALPRFVTRGDRIEARMLVDNQTAAAGSAVVHFDVEGARRIGPAERRVPLGPKDRVAVPFTIEADRLGPVVVSARVRFGTESDGVRVELPSLAPTTWQTRTVASGRLGGDRRIAMQLPPDADPSESEVILDVSAGAFAQMGGAIDSLLEYPHGCVEQTTSRLIPLVQLERILERSGDPRLGSKAHRRRMNAAITHVLKHQNGDGGFGLWPSSGSESFLTAYALWGLETAAKAGYEVPARVEERGLHYLETHLGQDHDMHGQFADEETAPFAAYVLALSGHEPKLPPPDRTEQTLFGRGLLGVALAKTAPADTARRDPILAELLAATAPLPEGGKLVHERPKRRDLLRMGRDVRATSAAVEALLAAGRTTEADDLISGILASRRGDGSWGTTYNNLWALSALAQHAASELDRMAPVQVAIDAGGHLYERVTVERDAPLRTVSIPASVVFGSDRKGEITLRPPPGAAARFAARLRYAPDPLRQRPTDQGLSVTRTLVDADTAAPVSAPEVGQLVSIELRVRSRRARRQIAVQDFLPAGFEAVDTALAIHGGSTRQKDARGIWSHRELHDERVTFFANHLPTGEHTATYLARVTRAGTFVRPAPRAEAMYDPDVYGIGSIEHVTIVTPSP